MPKGNVDRLFFYLLTFPTGEVGPASEITVTPPSNHSMGKRRASRFVRDRARNDIMGGAPARRAG
jgi:hypothetical protein